MRSLKRRLMIPVFAVGLSSLAASAHAACSPSAPQLIIYHAGSLTAAFSAVENLFTQQTGVCVIDVAAGSVDAARRITTGQERCDIFASADFKDIDLLLKPAGFADYDILFAQGGMVLAYTTNSKNPATIAASGTAFNLRGRFRRSPTIGTRSSGSQGSQSAVPIPFSIRAAIAQI